MLDWFKSNDKKVYIGLCALLFLYLLLRCIYVPLVHDEAVTFFNYINSGRFIPFYDWPTHEDANNHVLNSFLSHLSFKVFGDNYLAFRLPSLLFSILCFVYVWKIASWIKSIRFKWFFILSILGAHYFIEFYSVTRGYGMSMALLLAAIFHLFRFFTAAQLKDLLRYLIFIFLALTANLTLVNTALIALVLIGVKLIKDRNLFNLWRLIPIVLVGGLLPVLGAIITGFKYKEMGLLYYGQGESYWAVTVKSFFRSLTSIEHPEYVVLPIAMIMIGLSLCYFLYRLLELKFNSINSTYMLFGMFFFGNLAASIIQTSFMDVNYPEDRTALFFFPFLIGMLCFQNLESNKLKWVSLPLLFLPLQFLFSMNLTHNSFWKLERLPERMYLKVHEYYETNDYQPTIGGYQIRQVVWDYYNHKHGGDLGRIQNKAYPMDTVSDFIIAIEGDNPHWKRLYTSIDQDPYSKLHLFKRNQFLKPELVFDSDILTWVDSVDRQYIDFDRFHGPFELNKFYMAEFELDYRAHTAPNNALLVVQGVDENGKNTFMQNFSLERFRSNYDHDIHCKQKLITPPLDSSTVEIRLYLYNKGKERITIMNGDVKLYKF